ncbi:MAG: glycosyltransferase family 4 protein [Bacteroidia bacterium]|nr:glycosyltransferase family 4 protein [Bacteroidia bacterium]
MKIKILYVISLVESSHTFESTFKHIDLNKYELSVVFMHTHEPLLMKKVMDMNIDAYHIPFYKNKIKDIWVIPKLIRLILKVKPSIVHVHLIDGSFFGLIAAYICRVKTRIHTRHHSTHHWVYAPHAVKFDRLINSMATKIIAVSNLVREILIEKENVSAQKVSVVHHGFDLRAFQNRDSNKIGLIKEKYNLNDASPIIGNISRFIEEKGTVYVVRAFKIFLIDFPNAVLVMANARGVYKDAILKELETIPKESYRIIDFETDIASLYHCFDIFTHVPIDYHTEAFGQIYVEALASKVPSIFTDSGIATEFIEDKKNALLVPYRNDEAIYQAMNLIMSDKDLKENIIRKGFDDVVNLFSIENIIKQLEKEYHV